jgi:hypothetical protein
VQLYPGHYESGLALAKADLDQSQYERTLAHAGHAVTIPPNNALAQLVRAWAWECIQFPRDRYRGDDSESRPVAQYGTSCGGS